MSECKFQPWDAFLKKKIFMFHEKYDDFDRKVKINGDKRWDKMKMRWDKYEIRLIGNEYRGKKFK